MGAPVLKEFPLCKLVLTDFEHRRDVVAKWGVFLAIIVSNIVYHKVIVMIDCVAC
jgi:hypothetical protein